MLSWNQSARGSWNLHGHIHSGPRSTSIDAKTRRMVAQYDVGVDANNFTPVSYHEVKVKITKQYLNKK